MGAGSVEAVVEHRHPPGHQLDLGAGKRAPLAGGGRIADQAVVDVVRAAEVVQGAHLVRGEAERTDDVAGAEASKPGTRYAKRKKNQAAETLSVT